MEQNPNGVTPPGLEHIKRIVVVMFENRSFDHVFGALPGVNGLFENGQINQNYYNLANPLEPPSSTNPAVYPVPVDHTTPLPHDFTHDFGDGMMPDLFGPTFTITPSNAGPSDGLATYSSGYVNGAPTNQVQPPPQTYPPTNSGFYTTYNDCKQQGQSALTYFADGVLQILPALAKSFVVCDNWHCDMPGHTLVNRHFYHCGTTGVYGINDSESEGEKTYNHAPTVFNLLDKVLLGSSQWKMYAPATESKGKTILGHLDTRFLNTELQSYAGAPLTEFATDCQNGTLPFYSFVMCWLPSATAWTDTSMHPRSMIQPGENLLAAIYNTLRNSPCWEDTLLIVNFDENGGIYDHVFPPTAVRPDPSAKPATQDEKGSCLNKWILDSQFDFSLLGIRIPVLLISPWLAAGVDSQLYQNTSVLRFLIDKLNAEFGTKFGPLTQRDATAPQLDSAFAQFGQNTMRQDCPTWIAPYTTLPSPDTGTGSDAIPFSDGKLTTWVAPARTSEAPPVPYIDEVLNIYVSQLPGHPDSGKKITRTFSTNAEVEQYVEERFQAAADLNHPNLSRLQDAAISTPAMRA